MRKEHLGTPVVEERNAAPPRPAPLGMGANGIEVTILYGGEDMDLKPIGIIHSPYKNSKERLPQGREEIGRASFSARV